MAEDKSGLDHKFKQFEYRLTEQEHKVATQGVLSGESRLKANALQIQRVYAARLAEELAKGSKYAERRAMVAAEIEALKLSFSTWFALIDRGFKGGQ